MRANEYTLKLFASNDDIRDGKVLKWTTVASAADLDRAARELATSQNVPGSSVRAYDATDRFLGDTWRYTFPDLIVSMKLPPSE